MIQQLGRYLQTDSAWEIIKPVESFQWTGGVSAGIAIYDVMRYLPNPISTICYGETMGISCLILSVGTHGMRFACPNARIALEDHWSSRIGHCHILVDL